MVARRRLSHRERKALYEKYLKTEHWRARREIALRDAHQRCQDCGRGPEETGPLEVHHLTYARLFQEKPEDLRVLCRDCHGRRHGYLGEEDMQDFNTHKTGGRVVHHIDAAMQAAQAKSDAERLAKRSPRIGASRLGESCLRRLQYEYFKAPKDAPFTGKALRIFHRGHEGEAWMAAWFRAAGFTLHTHAPAVATQEATDGDSSKLQQNSINDAAVAIRKQAGPANGYRNADGQQMCFRAMGGRVLGYADGVFLDGPAECGPYPRLWENKVLGAKGWNKLGREGLKKAYPVYYGQVQLYMAYFELTEAPALFTALNADSMEILALDVAFDAGAAQELSDRAVNLVSACEAGQLLPRCTQDESWFECKFCDYHERCWRASGQ